MARSRFRRTPDALPPLRLTSRDDAILRDIDRLGPCLVDHLRRLHFPSYKTAAERAMKLFHHRFLDRLPLPATSGQPAMAHGLAPRGIDRLAEIGIEARTLDPAVAEDPERLAEATARAGVLADFLAAGRHPGLDIPVVEAAPSGDGLMPHGLVVIDVPARLFRRVLLLDFAPGGADELAARLGQWRMWAARPPATIEGGLQAMLDSRDVARTSHRARVSIGLLVADDTGLDAAAKVALEAGCGALIHLAALDRLSDATPFDPIWVQARDRARDGRAARCTSVLN